MARNPLRSARIEDRGWRIAKIPDPGTIFPQSSTINPQLFQRLSALQAALSDTTRHNPTQPRNGMVTWLNDCIVATCEDSNPFASRCLAAWGAKNFFFF